MYRNIIYIGKAARYDSLLLTLDGEPLITLNILSAAILFADFLLFPCPWATQEWIYKEEVVIVLYYYMRNFCNLIGLEQWYFSLIWNTYMWKLQNLLRVVV